MNIKQEKFCKVYAVSGNGKSAYEAVYTKASVQTCTVNASKLLKREDIKLYIEKLVKENYAGLPSSDDITHFWKSVMLDEEIDIDIRLMASKYIATSMNMFTEEII